MKNNELHTNLPFTKFCGQLRISASICLLWRAYGVESMSFIKWFWDSKPLITLASPNVSDKVGLNNTYRCLICKFSFKTTATVCRSLHTQDYINHLCVTGVILIIILHSDTSDKSTKKRTATNNRRSLTQFACNTTFKVVANVFNFHHLTKQQWQI